MLPALLLLPALLQPAQLATVHYGCLLKSHSTAADGSFGRYVSSSTEDCAKDCALACSLNDECDTFDYNGTQCVLKVAATVEPSTHSSTAGWCPNGKEQQESSGAPITPAPAPYKCSATSGEVCRFPFRLDGQVHWDCVERAGTPVCNVKEDSRSLQSFDSTATFQPCAACAECPQEGTDYSGFYLYSTSGNSDYNGLTSSEECQALCQLAPGCNFFTYGKAQKRCWLNYGVGQKVSRSNYFFGPKYDECTNTGSNSANTDRAGPTTNNSNNNNNDTNNHAGASRVAGPFLIFLVGLII